MQFAQVVLAGSGADRGGGERELEDLVEEQVTQRAARLGDALLERLVPALEALPEPGAVGGDDNVAAVRGLNGTVTASLRIADDRLHRLDELDDVVRPSAVEVVHEEQDRPWRPAD